MAGMSVDRMSASKSLDELWPGGALGEVDDDLSGVLRNVRVNRLPATRDAWANAWQTRAFLILGLRILDDHHRDSGTEGAGINLWGKLTPENLANRAQQTLSSTEAADALSVTRWKETWGHRGAYTEDLIAYLFRTGPSVRRLTLLGDAMAIAPGMSLGAFMRAACHAEYRSAAENPLQTLSYWLQAAMPAHAQISRLAVNLETTTLPLRAGIYRRIFGAYGFTEPDGVTWEDIAETALALLKGVSIYGRVRGRHPEFSNGDPALISGVLTLVQGWFGITRAELDTLLPLHEGPLGND
jgi:hypothetical protein